MTFSSFKTLRLERTLPAYPWGDGEEVKAEQNIVLITKALNAHRLAKKRRA